MKGFFILTFVICALIPLRIYSQPQNQTPYKQQKRIALVIGNGNYLTGYLANPANDARSISEVLKSLGFEVIKYENLNQAQMKKVIDEFGMQLRNYNVGLFFYAGHGIQLKGYNYLIPVDAQLETEVQIEYDCLQADRVIAQMENSGAKTKIIILDACRNNPFERSWTRSATTRGLATMNAPSGTLIAYATAPGTTASDGSGRNGLYTSALLNYLAEPDLKIEDVFKKVRVMVKKQSYGKQIPWESTSLEGDLILNPTQTLNNINNEKEIISAEEVLWEKIKFSDDPFELLKYLSFYKQGKHRDQALSKLDSLLAAPLKKMDIDKSIKNATRLNVVGYDKSKLVLEVFLDDKLVTRIAGSINSKVHRNYSTLYGQYIVDAISILGTNLNGDKLHHSIEVRGGYINSEGIFREVFRNYLGGLQDVWDVDLVFDREGRAEIVAGVACPVLYISKDDTLEFVDEVIKNRKHELSYGIDTLEISTDNVEQLHFLISERKEEISYIDYVAILLDGRLIKPEFSTEYDAGVIGEADKKYLILKKGESYPVSFKLSAEAANNTPSIIKFIIGGYYDPVYNMVQH